MLFLPTIIEKAHEFLSETGTIFAVLFGERKSFYTSNSVAMVTLIKYEQHFGWEKCWLCHKAFHRY